MDGANDSKRIRLGSAGKRLQPRLDADGIQDKPRGMPKTRPRKPLPRAKVKPKVKIGDKIKGGNSWHTGKLIEIGVAVIVCRDHKGFTFTKPNTAYEFPES